MAYINRAARRRKAREERRQHRRMRWCIRPIHTLEQRCLATLELPPAVLRHWLRGVSAGGHDCIRCGATLGTSGAHEPAVIGTTTLPDRAVVIAMCLTCTNDFDSFEEAGHAMVGSSDLGIQTKGRVWRPTHDAQGGVQ